MGLFWTPWSVRQPPNGGDRRTDHAGQAARVRLDMALLTDHVTRLRGDPDWLLSAPLSCGETALSTRSVADITEALIGEGRSGDKRSPWPPPVTRTTPPWPVTCTPTCA